MAFWVRDVSRTWWASRLEAVADVEVSEIGHMLIHHADEQNTRVTTVGHFDRKGEKNNVKDHVF